MLIHINLIKLLRDDVFRCFLIRFIAEKECSLSAAGIRTEINK